MEWFAPGHSDGRSIWPLAVQIEVRVECRMRWNLVRSLLIPLAAVALLAALPVQADDVPVRHKEGVVHGFLVLRSEDGKAIADGDLIQTVRSELVTSRLVFRFKDGSLHDDGCLFATSAISADQRPPGAKRTSVSASNGRNYRRGETAGDRSYYG
jgi:hypothetical protein